MYFIRFEDSVVVEEEKDEVELVEAGVGDSFWKEVVSFGDLDHYFGSDVDEMEVFEKDVVPHGRKGSSPIALPFLGHGAEV